MAVTRATPTSARDALKGLWFLNSLYNQRTILLFRVAKAVCLKGASALIITGSSPGFSKVHLFLAVCMARNPVSAKPGLCECSDAETSQDGVPVCCKHQRQHGTRSSPSQGTRAFETSCQTPVLWATSKEKGLTEATCVLVAV